MTVDYYELLGVDRDADAEEIATAFRRQAARHHPDVSEEPDAEERFKRLQRAKEVLTDEESRREYDRLGHERFVSRSTDDDQADARASARAWSSGNVAGGPTAWGVASGAGAWDLGTLFDRFLGDRGGPFGRRPPGGDTSTGRRPTGAARRATVEIDLEEAFHGAEKQVTITRHESCPTCAGEGYLQEEAPTECPKCNGRGTIIHVRDTGAGRSRRTERCAYCDGTGALPGALCPDCEGEGRRERQVTVDVAIPPGVESGQTLTVEDAGDLGRRGTRGDLLAEVEVEEHPTLRREGADLHTDHPLSFPQAVFGDTVGVSRFDDAVELTVPSGTQSGETFRVPSAGMPRFERSGRGDLYVRIQVVTPEDLTDEQRRTLHRFDRAGEFESTT